MQSIFFFCSCLPQSRYKWLAESHEFLAPMVSEIKKKNRVFTHYDLSEMKSSDC